MKPASTMGGPAAGLDLSSAFPETTMNTTTLSPRSFPRLVGLALALSCAAATGSCTDDEDPARVVDAGSTPAMSGAKVLVISVDGLRPDAITRAPAPNIMALAAKGARTFDAQTIRPSITLPSHTSMMTGFGPSEHGILWNDYRPGYVKETTPTVLGVAKKAGIRAVLVSGKEKFNALSPPGGTDVFVWASGGDADVAETAITELARGFGLALVHFPGTDDMGHQQGWMSESYLAQVRAADAAVGKLLAKLPADTNVILTADHGGSGNNHAEDIPENTTIPWIIAGPGVRAGHQIQFDVWTTDTAATVAHLLKVKLPGKAIGRPVEEAFTSFTGKVESCGDVPNAGEVVVEQILPEEAPAPMGGTPAPGEYKLKEATIHAPGLLPRAQASGRRMKGALRVSPSAGGAFVIEQVDAGISGPQGMSSTMGGMGMMMGSMGMGGTGMPAAAPPVVVGPERRSRFQATAAGATLERRPLCSRAVEPGSVTKEGFTATADEILIFGQVQANTQTGPTKLNTVLRYTR